MPPTEPAPYQPTVADIERRDDAERKQHDARASGHAVPQRDLDMWAAAKVTP